ncbi:hypothetical protein L1987_38170 [Smallanthus sonchifolius]|uniref:Uncharacterized protein n=1 Tax=Smallanthus sonchifolius TaxID=185202 RepID=A0ACB9HK78_9ASTR|nr:hypothetical protein L1987_38170 [Smallanthus sonchifolius]
MPSLSRASSSDGREKKSSSPDLDRKRIDLVVGSGFSSASGSYARRKRNETGSVIYGLLLALSTHTHIRFFHQKHRSKLGFPPFIIVPEATTTTIVICVKLLFLYASNLDAAFPSLLFR